MLSSYHSLNKLFRCRRTGQSPWLLLLSLWDAFVLDDVNIDCSQPLFFNARERKSERNEREARGGGDGRRAKRAKRRVFLGPYSLPHRVSSSALASSSRDSIRAFNDGIKIRQNRGYEQSMYTKLSFQHMCRQETRVEGFHESELMMQWK